MTAAVLSDCWTASARRTLIQDKSKQSDSISRRMIDIYAEKTKRISLIHGLASYDTPSVVPSMILHLAGFSNL